MSHGGAAIPAHLLRDRPPALAEGNALRHHRQAARDNPLPEVAASPSLPSAFLAQHPLASVTTQQGLLACLHDRHAASVISENGLWQRAPHYNPALAPASAALLVVPPEPQG
jgi:hypothetical protein